jgi:anti-sigma regulatory factor (Ser/Thr protein kinase)
MAASGCWNRVFVGSWQEVSSAVSWVKSVATDLDLPDAKAYDMQVCLEELMTNIVRHGATASHGSPAAASPLEGANGPLQVSVTLDSRGDGIHMIIEDNGRPFDITAAAHDVVDQSLDEIEAGGLGIGLVKSFSENLHYDRTEKGNRVSLQFIV